MPRNNLPRNSLLLLLVLLLTASLGAAAPGLAWQGAPVTLTVVAPAQPVPAGQTFEVQVLIQDAENVGSFEFQLVFNPAVVDAAAADISLGSFLGGTGRSTGELRLDPTAAFPEGPWYGSYSYGEAAGPGGNGQAATVSMAAVAAGSSDVALHHLQVTDVDGRPVPAAAVAGQVLVEPSGQNFPLFLPILLRNAP